MASRSGPKRTTQGTPRSRKPSSGPRAVGRPSAYRDDYARIAETACALGATDVDLAKAFGVSEQTVNAWKQAHPAFKAALEAGKDHADGQVVRSLYQRALGYSHSAVKILTVSLGDGQGSEVQQVPYTEHYPPDTTACIFWLKNRRRNEWRDKQDVEHTADASLAALCHAAFGAPPQ